jgi:tetratricopeptide (TPR) repeat protein
MIKIKTHAVLASLVLLSFVAVAEAQDPSTDELTTDEIIADELTTDELTTDELTTDEIIDPSEQTVAVAEEALPAVPDDPLTAATEEQLLEEFARYRRLVQAGTLDEADNAAKRIVEMAIRIYGPGSRETASALNNLGVVQHSTGQYDAAIQNFTSAVEIIEVVEDRLNGALVNPLKGLGASQLASGRPDQARKTFYRAAHITHVNEGPHNLDQIEILESIAETFIRMGNTKEARDALDRIHILNVKHFEEDPMGLLPSLMNRATWQHRAGYYNEERATYRRAIRIIESSSGKNNKLLVEPLRRLGESFYFIDTTLDQGTRAMLTGEIYFKRGARIAEKSDDIDWRENVAARLALADYYIYSDSIGRARNIYARVWQYLSVDEERLLLRSELLSDAVPIKTDQLPMYAGGSSNEGVSPGDIAAGRVVVKYDVSERGRVRNLQSEAFPAEFSDMQRMVHREMRSRTYRPRIVDGEPVESLGIVFEHPFSYRLTDLEALRKALALKKNSANK